MSIINSKHSKKSNGYWIAKGFIKLFDGLVCIISLGFYWSDLEYKFTKRQLTGPKPVENP